MPTPKGYTTKEAVENYILDEIDSSFDGQVDSWICTAEKIIDNVTQRNFKADETATARLFDGDGSNVLLVDDCVAVTLVEQGQDSYGGTFESVSASGSDRYFLDPANGTPKTKITLSARLFPCGKQNVRVTAKWGHSVAVPDDVTFAATVIVAGICNAQRKDRKEISQEKIGNYSVSYASEKEQSDFEQAKAILETYKRISL